MTKLDEKVALVSGASSGIGEATALVLAAEGAKVGLVARREERLKALKNTIAARGGQAISVVADLADLDLAQQAVDQVQNAFGRLDILVNNAGVMYLSPIAEAKVADWQRMIQLDLLSLMTLSKRALHHMQTQGSGHIINISSVMGRTIWAGRSAGYSAAKWGVGAFSEVLRQEAIAFNVRVTLIEPGAVDTELSHNITNPAVKEEVLSYVANVNALQSEDVASAILYAVTQPSRVNVNEIMLRPLKQEF
ncbi:MAG: SDR family NAD(P)-dependent oxidoreductase [Desulfobacterales bacterium]|nr:SDR family NAD(P)-dependent oxidoreductase [Desulfobacterales bacterium]